MRFVLPFLLLLPLVDMALAAWLLGVVGWPVLGALLMGGLVGAWLLRREKARLGLKLSQAYAQAARSGQPGVAIKQVFASLGRLGAALLFMYPGFLTDFIAVVLLIFTPAPRLASAGSPRDPTIIDGVVSEVQEPPAQLADRTTAPAAGSTNSPAPPSR
jgi:UPF0716 family protein affecting phage T7 exclusion